MKVARFNCRKEWEKEAPGVIESFIFHFRENEKVRSQVYFLAFLIVSASLFVGFCYGVDFGIAEFFGTDSVYQ